MAEQKFIDGLYTEKKENSPEFVLANLSFQKDKFIKWLNENANEKGYVNIQVLKSKEGKVYSKANEFKPKETAYSPNAGNGYEISSPNFESNISNDPLPF
jgi:hypothetical protein